MANKIANRGVSVYIDGVKVKNSVKAIQRDLNKVTNSLADMEIGSNKYIAATKKIAQLKSTLQEHKDYQKAIGKEYGNMQKGASKYFNSFQVFLGNMYTKGLQLVIRGLGDAVNKIRSFEKANVVLAGILGENKNDIKDLSTSAIELGKSSKYSASQVTELQTELAKLGFARQEIKDSQKYILDFATAMDASLPEAASLAGASLRAFGEETTETERYVSAMTIAANKSALGFEYLATAMPTIAPVAKAFNFSIEDTLALLGNLSDSGFDASSAATSLRNILLNLADSNGKLAKAIGGPVKDLDGLVKGFQDLRDKGIDLATALEITDKRSVAAFQTFLQGADKLVPLRDSLIGVGDQLDKLAKDQMDNLDGSIWSLQSSWEGLMLSFSNSSGAMKTVVDGITWIVDKATEAIEAMGKIQDSSAYKSFINEKRQEATIEFELKLRKGVEGKTFDVLQGEEKQAFEDAVKSNLSIEKEVLRREIDELTEQQNEARKKRDEIVKQNKEDLNGWGRMIPFYNLPMATNESEAQSALTDITAKTDIATERLNALNDAYNLIIKQDKKASTDSTDNPPGGKEDKASVQRKKINDALRVLEEQHLKDMSTIKQNYLNGDILSEEAYNDKILEQQDEYDEKRKKKLQDLLKSITDPSLRIDIAKQIADMDAKALDRQIADKAKKQKDAAKKEQDLLKWNEEETKKILEASLKYVATEEDKAYTKQMELRAEGKISEAEYQKELTNIQMRYLEERLRINGLSEERIADLRKQMMELEIDTLQDIESKRNSLFGDDMYAQLTEQMKSIDEALLSGAITFGEAVMLRVEAYMGAVNQAVQLIGSNLSGAMDNFTSAEESKVSRKYDKEIAAAEGNSKKQKKLEEKKQKELNAVRAKYADKQFAITTAMTIASTAQAAMEAYKAMAGIPVVGPALGTAAAAAAIVYGASQIAVAKEQRDAAKEGYFDGGFTGGVDSKQVRGYLPGGEPVHGAEFVANRHATANGSLLPLFNMIDEAQKHGTAGSLTKTDLAKALDIPDRGYAQGGFSGTPVAAPNNPGSRNDELFNRVADTLERLEERLNIPFTGIVRYKGDDGIEEAQNLNEKIMKYVSR